MAFTIIVTGVILGLIVGAGLKTFSGGYGFVNDIDNTPVRIKSCLYCNHQIPRSYHKNLCPSCLKPLE